MARFNTLRCTLIALFVACFAFAGVAPAVAADNVPGARDVLDRILPLHQFPGSGYEITQRRGDERTARSDFTYKSGDRYISAWVTLGRWQTASQALGAGQDALRSSGGRRLGGFGNFAFDEVVPAKRAYNASEYRIDARSGLWSIYVRVSHGAQHVSAAEARGVGQRVVRTALANLHAMRLGSEGPGVRAWPALQHQAAPAVSPTGTPSGFDDLPELTMDVISGRSTYAGGTPPNASPAPLAPSGDGGIPAGPAVAIGIAIVGGAFIIRRRRP